MLGAAPGLSSSGRVFQVLRSQIIAMKLPPGTILNRAELADVFGVSQSPVREAILRLEALGLVVSFPQSRTEVTRIDPVRLKQESFFRTALECEVVDQLCRAEEAPNLTRAKSFLATQETLLESPDQIELFRELDERFHLALFEAADQSALHALVVERSSHMARLRTLDLPRPEKLQSVTKWHGQIIDRIEAGDRQCAVDAMRNHLSGTIGRIGEIMETHRDFFA